MSFVRQLLTNVYLQMLEMLVQLQKHSTSHRDIKPANMLYMANSAVLKLGEFVSPTYTILADAHAGSQVTLEPLLLT